MKSIINFFKRVISCITPGYVAMLFAAFVLWYITKLGETYTTDHDVVVVVAGEEYDVNCTIRGKGTNLISYTMTRKHNMVEVPIEELAFEKEVTDDAGVTYHYITMASLQKALNTRMSDIEVVSLSVSKDLVLMSTESEGINH